MKNFLRDSEVKNFAKIAVFKPFMKAFLASLFEKTEIFSFFVDGILQNCCITILMVQKDSRESGEHSKYLQSISEVSRKDFQTHLRKSYFFRKSFF